MQTITVYTFGTICTTTHKRGVFAITHKPEDGLNCIKAATPQHLQPGQVFTVEKEELDINRYISMNMLNLTEEEINELNKQYNLTRTKEWW
jgi:hypothetical protein